MIHIHMIVLKTPSGLFSNKKNFELSFLKKYKIEELYKCANSLVQYGWKKEAIPVVHEKKSIITRIFNLFFD